MFFVVLINKKLTKKVKAVRYKESKYHEHELPANFLNQYVKKYPQT